MTQSKVTPTDFIEFIKDKGMLPEFNHLVKQTGTGDKKSKSSRTPWTFISMLGCDPCNYVSETLKIVQSDDYEPWLRLIPEWRNLCVPEITESEV